MKVNVYCEMHVCLRVLMRLCRWAGFFPVEGLDKLNMCEISKVQSIEDFVYYFYSFSFLLTRSCVTSFLAANIHTVSKRPLMIIQHLPSAEYDIEIQRLIRQIRYTTTALSGVFFHITRGMILQVIANIVKYELVLVQFARRKYQALSH
nr:gustatory receptor for sugar taste 64e-like [Danaus plexippus plexippus]